MANARALMNLAVLLLAISQLVHTATPRQLPPATPITASPSSLLVTSVSGDGPSNGVIAAKPGATEEKKALFDAPKNVLPLPPCIPTQQGEEKALFDAPKDLPRPPPPCQ